MNYGWRWGWEVGKIDPVLSLFSLTRITTNPTCWRWNFPLSSHEIERVWVCLTHSALGYLNQSPPPPMLVWAVTCWCIFWEHKEANICNLLCNTCLGIYNSIVLLAHTGGPQWVQSSAQWPSPWRTRLREATFPGHSGLPGTVEVRTYCPGIIINFPFTLKSIRLKYKLCTCFMTQ